MTHYHYKFFGGEKSGFAAFLPPQKNNSRFVIPNEVRKINFLKSYQMRLRNLKKKTKYPFKILFNTQNRNPEKG
jgi:hypothetical protein